MTAHILGERGCELGRSIFSRGGCRAC